MKEEVVGKIKNITFNEDTGNLEFTVFVEDAKFKKKLLRDLSLTGNIKVDGNNVVYIPNEDE